MAYNAFSLVRRKVAKECGVVDTCKNIDEVVQHVFFCVYKESIEGIQVLLLFTSAVLASMSQNIQNIALLFSCIHTADYTKHFCTIFVLSVLKTHADC